MAPTNKQRSQRESPLKKKKKRSPFQDTRAKFALREQALQKRHKQVLEAVDYCKKNNCKGKKALSSGLFPLIKDYRAINTALERGTALKYAGNSNTILTHDEELTLVSHIRNRNRAGQGMKRKAITRLVTDILTIRSKVNMKCKGGRKYIPLSKSAKNLLLTKKLSKSFWRKLEMRYNITRKRQGTAAAQVQYSLIHLVICQL